MSPPDAVPGSVKPVWYSGFAALGPDFACPQHPEPMPQPHWVARCDALAQELALDADWMDSPHALQLFSGATVTSAAPCVATVYAGHQFGVWAGQLGDGRALLLGELVDRDGSRQEVALKGAGRTPYSRSGDGRAVLRSSIREFLCSEAMHGLGIPTTRALCITGSPLPVWREQRETAAVVTRVAPSFVRFGHFEHFAHLHLEAPGQPAYAALRRLTSWVMERHFPDCTPLSEPAAHAQLLRQVSTRTAQLMAAWQSVGFCHGVMNTDNMSVLGLTLDYGPFQFLDHYDPMHICNHSDHQGRYAFGRQPAVAHWNLFALAQALLPLIGDEEMALQALADYPTEFDTAWRNAMAAKLGLAEHRSEDAELLGQLLALLHAHRLDYTRFWRHLSLWVAAGAPGDATGFAVGADAQAALEPWLARYRERLGTCDLARTGQTMLRHNPKYILRTHLTEQAIRQAQEHDFSEIDRLLAVLQSPFDEHSGCDAYCAEPPAWAHDLSLSCSS